jgi:hypothetical protein
MNNVSSPDSECLFAAPAATAGDTPDPLGGIAFPPNPPSCLRRYTALAFPLRWLFRCTSRLRGISSPSTPTFRCAASSLCYPLAALPSRCAALSLRCSLAALPSRCTAFSLRCLLTALLPRCAAFSLRCSLAALFFRCAANPASS